MPVPGTNRRLMSMHDRELPTEVPVGAMHPMRRLVLLVVQVGAVGLLVELLLIEHFEDAWQFVPLVLLVLVLLASVLVAVAPRRAVLRAFQGLMALCLAAGALGVWLHYRGNVEFASEQDPTLTGARLFWEAVRGATPALAPGALAQLGLLGLIYTFHHPALARAVPGDAHPLREKT